jgi:hypothetical protein
MNGHAQGNTLGTQPLGPPQFIGSRISLLSKMNVRYEGVLYSINAQDSTVQLQNVRCYGTEDRVRPDGGPPVPPSLDIYSFIVFRGADIQDLKVVVPAPVAPPQLPPQQGASLQSVAPPAPPHGYPPGTAPSSMMGPPYFPPYGGNMMPTTNASGGHAAWAAGSSLPMPQAPPQTFAPPRSDTTSYGQPYPQQPSYRYDVPPVQQALQGYPGAPLPTFMGSAVDWEDRPSPSAGAPVPGRNVIENPPSGRGSDTEINKESTAVTATRQSQAEPSATRVPVGNEDMHMDPKRHPEQQNEPRSTKQEEWKSKETTGEGPERRTYGRPVNPTRSDRREPEATTKPPAPNGRFRRQMQRSTGAADRHAGDTNHRHGQHLHDTTRRGSGPSNTRTHWTRRQSSTPAAIEEFDFESMREKLQKSLLIEEEVLKKIREQPKKYDKNKSFFDCLGDETASEVLAPPAGSESVTSDGAQLSERPKATQRSSDAKNVETFGEAAIRLRRQRSRNSGHARQYRRPPDGRPTNRQRVPASRGDAAPKRAAPPEASTRDAEPAVSV